VRRQRLRLIQDDDASGQPVELATRACAVGEQAFEELHGRRHNHRRVPVLGRQTRVHFLTVEVWTTRGLVTHYLLFVISLADRVVDIVGITTRPDEAWMLQVGRNLIDSESGAMRGKGYLILDRDTKYTDQFRRLIRGSGTNVIRLPPLSPNLNAYAERFVRSIKFECLNRMIFIGQTSLRRAIAEYVDHYHGERNHQGLDNGLIRAVPNSAQGVGRVRRKQRLGGMLNFYCREAV